MINAETIYMPTVTEENYQWALPVDDDDFEVLHTVGTRALVDVWRPVRMKIIRFDKLLVLRHAFLPWCMDNLIVMRDEAIDKVGPVLAPHGVILPLECKGARLALFTAPPVEGVLDLEQSGRVERFSSGRLMRVFSPVFNLGVLGDRQAFMLAEFPRCGLCLTGRLVEEVLATGMTKGTVFEVPKWI
ncbi:MAG: hypothetical protein LBJ62_09415 [Bifidobacteriaceae bacterium]|jgi:hypothetical protein|nr:hypothetical protein [Bifidobacteriaceae bacterium]